LVITFNIKRKNPINRKEIPIPVRIFCHKGLLVMNEKSI